MTERWMKATITPTAGSLPKNMRSGPTVTAAIVGDGLSAPIADVQYDIFGTLNNLDPLPANTDAKMWYGLRWFRFRLSVDSADFYMRSDVVTISDIRDIETPLEQRVDAAEQRLGTLESRVNTIESQHSGG